MICTTHLVMLAAGMHKLLQALRRNAVRRNVAICSALGEKRLMIIAKNELAKQISAKSMNAVRIQNAAVGMEHVRTGLRNTMTGTNATGQDAVRTHAAR